MNVRVTDAPERQRYEIYLDERLAGVAVYRPAPGRLIFTHTEVDSEFEGRGLGSRLAKGALDDTRARGLRATIKCPFIGDYVRRHPEYADLLQDPAGPSDGTPGVGWA